LFLQSIARTLTAPLRRGYAMANIPLVGSNAQVLYEKLHLKRLSIGNDPMVIGNFAV